MTRPATRPLVILGPIVILALFSPGCPRSGGTDTTPASPGASALTIPPGPESADALRALDRRAEAGDLHAAWDRAHYLLDLYDDARYRGNDRSRQLLWHALGKTDARGAAATDAAIAGLEAEVSRVLRRDRLHSAALAAQNLLAFDRQRPTGSRELLRSMAVLNAAAGVDAVADNAIARLAGYCLRGFHDATRGPMRERAIALTHCLYPLYSSDPAPYLGPPDERPPLPRWQDLANELGALLDRGVAGADRLQPALRAMRRDLDQLLGERRAELPAEPATGSLPRADYAASYDWTPIAPLDAREPVAALVAPLQLDGRGVVALDLSPDTDRARFERARATARAAGAKAVDLLVALDQHLAVPEGDYRAQAGRGTIAERAGAVRLALDTSAGDGPEPDPSAPWNPRHAQLGLHLAVTPTHWRLMAPTGDLTTIKTATDYGDPRTALRVTLQRVQAAFPDEAGLVIVPEPGASYASIVNAAVAAARDNRGQVLFRYLALGDRLPAQVSNDLAERVERGWKKATGQP